MAWWHDAHLRQTALVHGLLLFIQVIFSVNQVMTKIGLRYFNPQIFIMMRCLMVLPGLVIGAKVKDKDILPKTRREGLFGLAMGVSSFLAFEFFIYGIKITSVATGTTLQATSPLWTLIIALILKLEGPSVLKIVGVIFAVVGAAVTVAGNQFYQQFFGNGPEDVPSSSQSDFPGGLLLLANAMGYACFVTAQKYVVRTVKPLTSTAWNVSIASFFLTCVGVFFVGSVDWGAVKLEGWGSVLYSGVFSMGVAYICLSWAASHTSTTVVAVYSTIMPVLSPIVSYFVLHESVQIGQIIGMVITLAGVFLVIRARYVEEQQRLQTERDDVAKANDDQAGEKLLEEGEKEREDGASKFVFESEQGNNWLYEDEEEEKKEGKESEKDGLVRKIEVKEEDVRRPIEIELREVTDT